MEQTCSILWCNVAIWWPMWSMSTSRIFISSVVLLPQTQRFAGVDSIDSQIRGWNYPRSLLLRIWKRGVGGGTTLACPTVQRRVLHSDLLAMLPHTLRSHPVLSRCLFSVSPHCQFHFMASNYYVTLFYLRSSGTVTAECCYSIRYRLYLIRCPAYHDPHLLNKNNKERNCKPIYSFQILC